MQSLKNLHSIILKNKKILLFLSFLCLIFIVYVPYILRGGFGVADDLQLLKETIHNSGFSSYLSYVLSLLKSSGWAARPIYSILIPAELYLYRDVASYYIITQLLIWMFGIYFIFAIIKDMFDEETAWLFAIMSSFPLFSSSAVFSLLMSVGYNLSISFWALSLFLIFKHCKNNKSSTYIGGYFFLILSLLTLELILPLLLVTAIFPIIYTKELYKDRYSLKKITAKYLLPIMLVSLTFFIFKIFFTKLYIIDDPYSTYGIAPISLKSILQSMYYFVAIFIEIPLLLIEALPFLFKWQMILVSVFVILFLLILKTGISVQKKIKPQQNYLLILLILVTLFSCSIIPFISNYPSVTFGYYNKMMHPSFILLSILVAYLFKKTLRTKKILFSAIISIIWISSFAIQLDNFSESWRIRKYVLNDMAKKLNDHDLGESPFVIANVPFFTLNNYNNEEVFFTTWDFNAGLQLFGLKKTVQAFPFCWRSMTDNTYNPAHNIKNSISLLENKNLWYYEYDGKNNSVVIEKIQTKNLLYEKFKYIESNNINNHPIIFREKIRNYLKINLNNIITHRS